MSLCFVFNLDGSILMPTKYEKGWYFIRKKKAVLISVDPFIIRLNYMIENPGLQDLSVMLKSDDSLRIIRTTSKGKEVIFEGKNIFKFRKIIKSLLNKKIFDNLEKKGGEKG